jgi:electron transport complex protein RnfB
MIWLNLGIVLLAAAASSFGTSFLSSAWKRLKKAEPEARRIEALLPGYDCSLCGKGDCGSYAETVALEGGDPALCRPGGRSLETRLRAILAERRGDSRAVAMRAVVRCGGREGAALADFAYDGRRDCVSAVALYGGPKRCKEGCVGFGTCVAACPLGAIGVKAGLACVDPGLCTGCGLCVGACPTGAISLLPRDQLWYVACASERDAESKARDCAAACTACGECPRLSVRSEFALAGSLAKENPYAEAGRWQDIAAACPTGAIVLAGAEHGRASPFRRKGRQYILPAKSQG